MAQHSPFSTGIRGRCPNCAQGALFKGFLSFKDECLSCGADFRIEDAGDGPAVFVILAVGIFLIPLALAFQLLTDAPPWVTIVVWSPILTLASIGLLRPFRGIMFSLQWMRKAKEARPEDFEPKPAEKKP